MSIRVGTEFAAIIAAGGSGSRFHAEKQAEPKSAKQFLTLRGLPLYAWSILAFSKHHLITNIILVTPQDMVQTCELQTKELKEAHNIRQLISVIQGGSTRQESVFCGLKALYSTGNPPEYVLIHDAARPFLDISTVDLVVKKAIEYGACTVGGAVSDTIKRVSAGKILETIPRDELCAVQTPQAARFSQMLAAHEEAALAQFTATDDASLLEWAGHEVYLVEGPKNNLKVTHPLDLILANALADYLHQDRL